MARVAKKDTFAYEHVGVQPGDDTEVRRAVFAGQVVPDHYRVENAGDVEEVDLPRFGLGAAPHGYKGQIMADGSLRDAEPAVEAEVASESASSAKSKK